MNLKTIKFLLSTILFVILILSCSGLRSGGAPCRYNNVDAYMIIDSIALDTTISLIYMSYVRVFNKSDNKPLSNVNGYISEYWVSSISDTNCILQNHIKVGDTISCRVDTITSGACTPVMLSVSDDYEECFKEWYQH